MGNLTRTLLPLATLSAVLAACGSRSATTPTALTSVTTAQTLSPATFTGPMLNVTQLGFTMTFPQQLGTVNYQIDGSNGGTVSNYNGVSARFVATVNLFTSLYAAACAQTTSTTTTSTTSTATGSSPAPLGTPTAVPAPPQSPVEAQILVWDNTAASSLGGLVAGAPHQWARAGSKLLGFREAPGFSGCGTKQLQLDFPLLQQMFGTARPD